MTYEAYEESTYSGSPVELFEFNLADTTYWRYTSADEDKTVSGNVYEAITIDCPPVESSQDAIRNSLTITMPVDTDLPASYVSGPPTDTISVTIMRYHEGDGNVIVTWVGHLINLKFGEHAEIICESLLRSLQRPFPKETYQIACTATLYSYHCGVDRALYKQTATLSAVDGLTLTSASFGTHPDDYFAGGYVEYLSGGLYTRRFIVSHTGNDIVTDLQLGAIATSSVDAYPGCNHTTSDCHTKFNNIVEYKGCPFIPLKNPFGSAPIY